MATRKLNLVTERLGVNYVRAIVEANNSIFKEVDLRHDYGHDAFVLIVDGEQVSAKEIAMQIKSGKSYCTPTSCKIPATGSQLTFWAGHDLDTLGVVYDPSEDVAYWVDLKAEATQRMRGRRDQPGAVIEFPKSMWNRLDLHMFTVFLIPILQGKSPHLDLDTAISWANSTDIETHDLGVHILLARHWRELGAWKTMLALFLGRQSTQTTPRIAIGLAKMMGHHDDGYSMETAPADVKEHVREAVLAFGPAEITKILSYVDEYDFGRPSTGYSLMPVLGARSDCLEVFATMRDDSTLDDMTRGLAAYLVELDEHEPFRFWHVKDS